MKKPDHKAKTAAKIVAGLAATAALCLNVNGCVYGPGPEEETTGHHDPDVTTTTEFNPEDNEVPAVYGPPSDETFAPEDNEPATAYGPPSDMVEEETDVSEGSETSVAEESGS